MLVRSARDTRRRFGSLLAATATAALWMAGTADLRAPPAADVLLIGGLVHDGSGQPPVRRDVGVTGERISFRDLLRTVGATRSRGV